MLAAYAEECRAAGHSPATIRLRLSFLSHVPDLLTATRGDLVAYLAGHDWSPQTRAAARSAVRSFYRWAVDVGIRGDDPTVSLRPIRVPAGLPKPTPDDVVETALLLATDRDRLMIGLGAWAGLRRAEIAGLAWSAIADGRIRVRGKGGRVREVAVAAQLGELLAAEQARRLLGAMGSGYRYGGPGSPWVFPGRSTGPMTPNSVGQVLKQALGGGWSAHTLRHRFATRAYAQTRDLLTLQDQLGHTKPETTARYAQIPADAAAALVAAAAG